jgi:hypothetical protein
MIARITTGVVLFALLTLFLAQPAKANEKLAGMSASTFIPPIEELKPDNRAKVLKTYLEKYNSPLADHADTFIKTADTYDLDWKLVAAIAGLESGYGKAIPPNSFNGWGWGIYGTQVHYFTGWDDGIETVSKGLRERYIGKGNQANIYAIGKTYAASPTWAVRVIGFMNQIDAFYQDYNAQNTSKTLSLSI